MMKVLSVSELNEQIKSLLESHFTTVWVEGEVSRPTYHTSGHLYFSLKDSGGVIRCVMFRSNLAKIPFRVEEGQKLIVSGRIGLYKPRGEYQLYAVDMVPSGEGSLQLAFNQLKEKLAKQGYFDESRKKSLPPFVSSIALVTSQTGAALQDMLRIAKRRWPLLKVYVVDTLVQGKEAAGMIAEAIEYADGLGVDVIVVGRGGGSLEDLWAFNEEVVAEAIYKASTPVVSAVGHEIDYLISDFVADKRAPTPSAAMEMILPSKEEILLTIDDMMGRYTQRMESILSSKAQVLEHLTKLLIQQSPQRRMELLTQQIQGLKSSFEHTMQMRLHKKAEPMPRLLQSFQNAIAKSMETKEHELSILGERFKTALEAKKLPPASAQIIKGSKPVSLEELKIGDQVRLQDMHWDVEVEVVEKKPI